MNKYRKAEARKVKAIMKLMNLAGASVSYKQLRRKLRRFRRAIDSLPKKVKRTMYKGIKRADYQFGLHADYTFIDESTPMKENPYFPTRYMGRFDVKPVQSGGGIVRVRTV